MSNCFRDTNCLSSSPLTAVLYHHLSFVHHNRPFNFVPLFDNLFQQFSLFIFPPSLPINTAPTPVLARQQWRILPVGATTRLTRRTSSNLFRSSLTATPTPSSAVATESFPSTFTFPVAHQQQRLFFTGAFSPPLLPLIHQLTPSFDLPTVCCSFRGGCDAVVREFRGTASRWTWFAR